MRNFSNLPLLLIVIYFLAISCNKEGPQGPAGPAGPAGVAGPIGPTGTANVIYSAWFTPAQNGGWVDTAINGVATQKKFNKPAPGITLTVLNTGLVMAYVKLNPDGAGGTTTSIRQLPYANPGTANVYMSLSYLSSITFAVISTSSPGVAVSAPSGSLEFRYLIIPGGVAGGRLADPNAGIVEINGILYTKAQLKAMPYEQVCSLLNVPR